MSDVLSQGNKDLKTQKTMGQAQGQKPTSITTVKEMPQQVTPELPKQYTPLGPTEDKTAIDYYQSMKTRPELPTLKNDPELYKTRKAQQELWDKGQNLFLNTKAGYTGVPSKESIAQHQNVQDDLSKELKDFKMPSVGWNSIVAPNLKGAMQSLPPRQGFSLSENNPAGPTEQPPQGLDWKRVLMTIGDAVAGGFMGAAGQKHNSLGIQQGMQRQANEQKQKEFEQQKEAQRQALQESTNAQEYTNEGNRQAQILLQWLQNEFDASRTNAQLDQNAQIANQAARAKILDAIIASDPLMALTVAPESLISKDTKKYLSKVLGRREADKKSEALQNVVNNITGGK